MTASPSLLRAARSEAVRLRRLWKIAALAVALAALATVLAFSGSGAGPGGRGADDGLDSAAASTLTEPDGIVAGLGTAGTIAGLLVLVLWALSLARDYQTGVIRVLLVTDARRGALLGGKLLALLVATVVTSLLAVAACVGSAYAAAAANGVSTALWDWSHVGSAALDLSLATAAWGAIGAALAVLTRSAAGAIAGGIGYLLLGENLLGSVWASAADWLPAGSVENVLAGGNADVSYATSATLVAIYLALAVAAAFLVVLRRDVTD